MTKNKKELLGILRALKDSGDPETAHANADRALIKFIGDDKIEDAYGEIDKWYA